VTKPECRRVIRNMGPRAAVPWATLFPRAETQALDLLGKLLAWNPANRITVEEALRHPWLAEYHDEAREPSCLATFDFDNNVNDLESGDLPASKIRKLMRAEISKMRIEEASGKDGKILAGEQRAGKGAAATAAIAPEPAAMAPAISSISPSAPPSAPPSALPSASSGAPATYLPVAQEANMVEDISAAAITAVRENVARQFAQSSALGEESALQSMLRRELEKMEVRILSQIRGVVDDVVTERLKEFAQSLEEGDE